jgi:type IX secretion system PorP/SprF family membrane protein
MQRLYTTLIFCYGLITCISVHAQQSIVYSQYIFNGLLINPAYAGSHVQLSATLTYRNQWVNFDGAPQTTTLGVHSTVRRDKVGLGLLMTSDKIGSYSNKGVFASYAYIIKNPFGGVLSLGVQAGFNNFKADYSALNSKSAGDPLFNAVINEFKPNFGGGIFYYTKRMFAGFSVPVILKYDQLASVNLAQLTQPRYYYLHAGTTKSLDRDEKFKVSPSILLRVQDGTPLSGDLNLNLIFYDQISIGSSYRSGDGIVSFVNFKLSEKFYFAYSYDWTVSEIRRYSKGSHELMLNYRVRLRGIHKDLECPYFFHH